MAKYLSQLDIDVYIYITEGDKEYQYDPLQDSKAKERAWKEFSEPAYTQLITGMSVHIIEKSAG